MEATVITTEHGTVEGIATSFGIFALVDPTWLEVDNGPGGYQRQRDEKHIQKIASEWDNHKARPSNVRLRGDRLFATNGSHTAAAAVRAGVPKIPVIIASSASRKQEAREFVDIATNPKPLTEHDKYRAALVAGDKAALSVKKVTEELGLVVSAAPGPKNVRALRALLKVAKSSGEDRLRDVLNVALMYPEDETERFMNIVLTGIAKAFEAHGRDAVIRKAKRIRSIAQVYARANVDAGGRGYVTISNIAAAFGS